MRWILQFADRRVERFVIKVTAGDTERLRSELVPPLTKQAAPRPGLSIDIPIGVVAPLIGLGAPIDVS